MSKQSEAVKTWRQRTKERIIESMGGKCVECEYSKCSGALDLHHLDPSKKSFSFAGLRARPKSWSTIVEELRKCTLLCCLCHREIELGVRTLKNTKSPFNEEYIEYELRGSSYTIKEFRYDLTCKVCNKKFNGYRKTAKYCSEKCRYNSKK